jgi:peptidoglycan/LPS O-acetylase OafA/YrhL
LKSENSSETTDRPGTVGHAIGASGRDNNFNLLRFVAATLVIWSHSYALLPNGLPSDPSVRVLGFGFAGIAVNAFFAISGFLIVRSYIRHNHLGIYLQARTLRIMPGLVVAVLFCALVIGPLFTSLPLRDYFENPDMLRFITSNIAMYHRSGGLPGVFDENVSAGVNGSLWTLSYEVSMYLAVAILGMLGLLKHRMGIAFICFVYTAYFIFATGHPDLAEQWLSPRTDKYLRLSLYFFLGGCLYVFRDRILLFGPAAIALWLLTLISYKSSLFNFIFTVALTYSVLWLALIPQGFVQRFNSLEDYSYGIYIYAYPVQQAIIATHNDIEEMTLFVTSFLITLVLAWLSCKLVEKPALKLSSRLRRHHYERKARRAAATG